MYTSCWLCNTDAVDKKCTTVTIRVEPCRLQQLVIVALKVKRDKTDHYGTDVTSMFLVRGSGNVESSSGTSSICCWCCNERKTKIKTDVTLVNFKEG